MHPSRRRYAAQTEVAKALGVHQTTVSRWCETGKIAAEKDPESGHWRVLITTLEREIKRLGKKEK